MWRLSRFKKCLWLTNTLFMAYKHFVYGLQTRCLWLTNTLFMAYKHFFYS